MNSGIYGRRSVIQCSVRAVGCRVVTLIYIKYEEKKKKGESAIELTAYMMSEPCKNPRHVAPWW